jgi:hypothetical protein
MRAYQGGEMKTNRIFKPIMILAVLISIAIWGCAGKPFEPPQTGEIPKGPGIFTKGDDGVVLYDSNAIEPPKPVQTAPEPASQKMDDNKTADPSRAADYAEFEAYQEFRAWKKSAAGTEEYEEFQQWRQWREYRQWKQQK